jgi:hypothetical protein
MTVTVGSCAAPPWWAARWFQALCLGLVMAPMAWPGLPPLTDLPGHLGRYKIIVDLGRSEPLRRFYSFAWSIVPNLGVDLLMVPFAAVFGLELGVKLIVMLTAALTLVGYIWVAEEAHGRASPAWLFAAPLILGYAFHYGFLNFSLALALCFLAFGLWLRLGRLGRVLLRAALFVPIALAIWLAHGIGWAMFGLLVGGFELARQWERGQGIVKGAVLAGWRCLPLAGPLVLTLAWSTGNVVTVTRDWFNPGWKLVSIAAALRDRWVDFDVASVCVLLAVITFGVWDRRVAWSRGLATGAALLLVAFILLPQILLGTSRADIRLVPTMLAMALLAMRPAAASPRQVGAFALAGLAFFVVRMGANTASLWQYDRSFSAELQALDHVPRGARLATFVGVGCVSGWGNSRLEHLGGMAIVRREAFSNEQWTVGGSHLLQVRPPWTRYVDPSGFVTATRCGEVWRPIAEALSTLPQADFDYVWLIEPHPHDPALTAGWTVLWQRGSSVLFRLPGAASTAP